MPYDPKKHIKISNKKQARELRAKLIEFVWKDEKIARGRKPTSDSPHLTCSPLGCNCVMPPFKGMSSLKSTTKFTLQMEHGINSYSYLYSPKRKTKNGLILYHHGHNSSKADYGQDTINFFLTKGYTVMGFTMPFSWPNNKPEKVGSRAMRLDLACDTIWHDCLRHLENEKFCPLKFFIEPVCAALNVLDENYNFDFYHMVGISGGGVTTMLCTAIDDRISHGYNVAGGIPRALRSAPRDAGDYEQVHPTFYNIASYLDLYILGSFGKARKCVQVYNKFDSCCFAGNPHAKWESEVEKASKKLGGCYKVYSDETHRGHLISPWALDKIAEEMKTSTVFQEP